VVLGSLAVFYFGSTLLNVWYDSSKRNSTKGKFRRFNPVTTQGDALHGALHDP
jgi:hypothetical protein